MNKHGLKLSFVILKKSDKFIGFLVFESITCPTILEVPVAIKSHLDRTFEFSMCTCRLFQNFQIYSNRCVPHPHDKLDVITFQVFGESSFFVILIIPWHVLQNRCSSFSRSSIKAPILGVSHEHIFCSFINIFVSFLPHY